MRTSKHVARRWHIALANAAKVAKRRLTTK